MSKSTIKFVRLSPTKARLIAKQVQGMNAEFALATLEFTPNRGAKYIATAISSAVNALDVASVGGNGCYISAISETDGKISATATAMNDTPKASSTKYPESDFQAKWSAGSGTCEVTINGFNQDLCTTSGASNYKAS